MGPAEKQKMSCTFATVEAQDTLSTPKTMTKDQISRDHISRIISMSIQLFNISGSLLLGANPVVE